MDYMTGLCFVNFLIVAFSIPVSTQFYSVDLEARTFDDAQTLCAPDGYLTNMPSQEETLKILKVIEDKGDINSTSFWIGLKKEKPQCIEENLPLKGFYWTIDNSTKFDLNKWKKEPDGTCTSTLCGLLSVEYKESRLISWGLEAKSCRRTFPFICKHKGSSKNKACSSQPQILGGHDITTKQSDPYTLWVSCDGSENFSLTCSKSTGEWKVVPGAETEKQGLCLCKKRKDKDGNCVAIDECKQFNNCTFKCINTPGLYSCLCDNDMHNSEICKKSTDTTFPPSPQPAVDITTESGVHIEENTGDLSNIVIPLIIALLIFVVLVVIIAAIVKCCLMRRARKRAKKRAAELKESVALNGSDSMEKVSE